MINTQPITAEEDKLITREELNNIFTEQLLLINFDYINDYLTEHKPQKTIMMSICGSDFHMGNKGKDKLCNFTVSIPRKSDLNSKTTIKNLVLTYFTNLDLIDIIRFGIYSGLKHDIIARTALMDYVIVNLARTSLDTNQEVWCHSFISQYPKLYAEELISLSEHIEPFFNNKMVNRLCQDLELYKDHIPIELLKAIAFLISSYIIKHPEIEYIYNDDFIKLMLMKADSNESVIDYFRLPITYLSAVLTVSEQQNSYKTELSHLHLAINSKADIVWLIDNLVQRTNELYSPDFQLSLDDALNHGLAIECIDESCQLYVQEWLNWIKYKPENIPTLNTAIKLLLRIFPYCHM